MKKLKQLDLWKRSIELSTKTYQITGKPTFRYDWSLRDQMRRASVSISSNIAEGHERDGNREFAQFLRIAKGSAGELLTQVHICNRIGYIDHEEFEQMNESVQQLASMIGGLIRYLAKQSSDAPKHK